MSAPSGFRWPGTGPYVPDTPPDARPDTEPDRCGLRCWGIMPPCVLPAGHAGDHEDGIGGFYTINPAEQVPRTPAPLPPLPQAEPEGPATCPSTPKRPGRNPGPLAEAGELQPSLFGHASPL